MQATVNKIKTWIKKDGLSHLVLLLLLAFVWMLPGAASKETPKTPVTTIDSAILVSKK